MHHSKQTLFRGTFLIIILLFTLSSSAAASELPMMKYNHPGLTVDLGVGLWAWPLPMDFDGDGDLDLVVSCPDVPFKGLWFFENPGPVNVKKPVFKAPVKISRGLQNVQISHVNGAPRILTPSRHYPDFRKTGLDNGVSLNIKPKLPDNPGRLRANQWKYVDYNGDGLTDLVIGIGCWGDYGWDNAFDKAGRWTRGPLRGFVYVLINKGTEAKPGYAPAEKIIAGGKPVDTFGMPSPNLADFDGDGDLDLICGEFIDGFTYFENRGTRKAPRYAAGRRLMQGDAPLTMALCMITPTAIDWDGDGDMDLISGDEDGRIALIEHTGQVKDGCPVFRAPFYFKQEANRVKFGALVTPWSVDFDGDGDEDLICGNTAGHICLIQNLDGGDPPKWGAPILLQAGAGGKTIHIQAGYNGSIQGPCERKWGYTTLSVADWNHDGFLDIMANSIWGRIVWFEGLGGPTSPPLAAAKPVMVQWPEGVKPPKPAWNWWDPEGNELATQWRTTPVMIDWNKDGLNDLVMLDHEGYLAFFRRIKKDGRLLLLPPERIFLQQKGKTTSPLRLNSGKAGRSGRRKLCFVDWDQDGDRDLIVNSINAELWRNEKTVDGKTIFVHTGNMAKHKLAGHTTSPTMVDWDKNGVPDLLLGAEDGHFYHLKNPARAKTAAEKSAGFVPLFAGNKLDMSQWQVTSWSDVSKPAPAGAAWDLRDGVLYGSTPRGTWLISKKQYADFELMFEFKLGPRGNSGCALRTPLKGDPAFDGLELQMADLRYNTRAKASELTGGFYRAAAPGRQVYKPEAWNSYHIILKGPQVKVTLNGTVIQDINLDAIKDTVPRHDGSPAPALRDRPRRGHIGFQELSRGGDQVMIRKAMIKILNPSSP